MFFFKLGDPCEMAANQAKAWLCWIGVRSEAASPFFDDSKGAVDKPDLVARFDEDGPGSTPLTASTASCGSLSASEDEAIEKHASNHESEGFLEAAQRHSLDSSGRCTAASTEDEEEDELRHNTASINAERHAKVSEALREVLGDAATFGEKDLDDIVRPRWRSINFKDSDIRRDGQREKRAAGYGGKFFATYGGRDGQREKGAAGYGAKFFATYGGRDGQREKGAAGYGGKFFATYGGPAGQREKGTAGRGLILQGVPQEV